MIAGILQKLVGGDVEAGRIATSAARILVLVLCAKLLIAGKELVLAYRFGIGTVVDAYNVAFTVTTWLPLLAASAAGAALVPLLVRLQHDPREQGGFLRELNGAVWLLAGLVSVLLFAFGPVVGRTVAAGLDQEARELVTTMVRSMALFGGLSALAAYYAIRLQAEQRFLYSFLEAMPALFVALFVLAAADSLGADSLVWGTLAGGAVQLSLLLVLTRRTKTGLGGIGFGFTSPVWAALWGGLGAMALGQLLVFMTVPMDQYFAGHATAGGIAALGYANRIIGLLSGLGTIVLARALLPILSGAMARGDHHLARREAYRWTAISASLGLMVALVGWFAADFVTRILLERGAFGESDTRVVAQLLRLGLLQLPFYLGGLVIVQWLAARRDYRLLALIAGACLLVKLLLLLLLNSYGTSGVMLSTVGMYATALALQFLALRLRP